MPNHPPRAECLDMDTSTKTRTPLLTQTPLGQPFIDHLQGFSRPFSDRFTPQDENLFWHKAILADAATFFFPPQARWYEAEDVELRVRGEGRRFGIVDCVLYSLETKGWKEVVAGYGSVVMQPTLRARDAVSASARMWERLTGPDDFSSARAYLLNQLVFEGGMYSFWGRRMAVVLEQSVYDTLPPLDQADEPDADIAWLIYDIAASEGFTLKRRKTVYTKYSESWGKMMARWTKKESRFVKAVTEKYWETIIRCDKHGNLIDRP